MSTLRLLHLADSAFPIGASAHSFGLETLTAEGVLSPQTLQPLLCDLLWESGLLETVFACLAYRLTSLIEAQFVDQQTIDKQAFTDRWLQLNRVLSACKPARESRTASATLGRRFLQTVAHLEAKPHIVQAQVAAQAAATDTHYCAAFGLVGGVFKFGEEETIGAYLQQSVMGLVSAALRLLPIGQGRAGELLWQLKPLISDVAAAGLTLVHAAGSIAEPMDYLDRLSAFTPMVDLASMRHPTLLTRLFIS